MPPRVTFFVNAKKNINFKIKPDWPEFNKHAAKEKKDD